MNVMTDGCGAWHATYLPWNWAISQLSNFAFKIRIRDQCKWHLGHSVYVVGHGDVGTMVGLDRNE